MAAAQTGDSFVRLVLRRGFAGLVLTLGALALALPALASETAEPAQFPVQTQSAPPTEPGPPADPGSSEGPPEQAPAYGTREPASAPAQDDPGTSEKTPAAETRTRTAGEEPAPVADSEAPAPAPEESAPGRVRSRSVGTPGFSEPLADEPAATPGPDRTERPRAGDNRVAARIRTLAEQPGERFTEALEALSGPGRRGGARNSDPSPRRSAAGEAPAARIGSPKPPEARLEAETAESEPSLPGRIVPRPLRRIVEVVPAELWAALGALALLALALAVSSWVTARRAARLRSQRAELLEEVGLLQAALLPPVPDHLPASVAYRPTEGPAAGGDFYEAFGLSDGRTGLILGDVSGHGREALARTTLIRYTLRAYLEAGLEPREVLKVGAEALNDHFGNGFATVTVAVHDPVSGRFTYASAGHAPPIVAGPAAHDPVTSCSAPPIGIDEPTGFRQTSFTLTDGSTACLYTDGLTEARRGGRMLGRAQIEEALAGLPADAGAEELLDRVAEMADEVADDMAVCLVRAPAGAPGEGSRIEELEVDEHEVGDSLELFLRACGVALAEVPGVLREAGEAARREGTATVRVRLNDFRPGVDVVPGNVVRLEERRHVVRL